MDFKRMFIESLEVPEAVPVGIAAISGYNVGVAKENPKITGGNFAPV